MKIKWVEVYERYEKLDNGSKALIKRSTSLEEIKLSLVLFQLGLEHNIQSSRIAFCIPFLKSVEDGNSIGKSLASLDDGDIGREKDKYTTIGKRMMRIVRLDGDNDLYEFRRLLNFIAGKSSDKKISVDIKSACKALYYWGEKSKKEIFENYLVEQYSDKTTKVGELK